MLEKERVIRESMKQARDLEKKSLVTQIEYQKHITAQAVVAHGKKMALATQAMKLAEYEIALAETIEFIECLSKFTSYTDERTESSRFKSHSLPLSVYQISPTYRLQTIVYP